jgi:hypothetical protein
MKKIVERNRRKETWQDFVVIAGELYKKERCVIAGR